jgi:hypothetical protein
MPNAPASQVLLGLSVAKPGGDSCWAFLILELKLIYWFVVCFISSPFSISFVAGRPVVDPF